MIEKVIRQGARCVGALIFLVTMAALASNTSAATLEGYGAMVAFHEGSTADSWFVTLPRYSNEEPYYYLLGPKAAAYSNPTVHPICAECDKEGAEHGYFSAAVNSEELGQLWLWENFYNYKPKWASTGLGFASHTSPSASWADGREVAFNAAGSEDLWIGKSDLGYPMASGTSPAASGGRGESSSSWVAFAGRSSNELELWHSSPKGGEGLIHTGLDIESSTNPTVVELENRKVIVAFQAAGLGKLGIYEYGTPGWLNTGLGMAASTSPSITEWGIKANGYLVAFQALGSQHVGVYQSGWEAGRWLDSGMAMQAGSSPSITTREVTWDVAFQGAGSHDLWTWSSSAGGRNWGWVLGEHSSPVIDGDNVK